MALAQDTYRQLVTQMWTDARLVEAELVSLTQLQASLGISHEDAAAIEREVMGMTKAEALVAGLNAQATPPPPGAPPIPTTKVDPEASFSGGATFNPGAPSTDVVAPDQDGTFSGERTLDSPGSASARQADGDQLHEGLRLGRDRRYELLDKVGEGGMGSVWRARDLNVDGRVVAMKRIRAFDAADRVMLQRFEQERGTIAGLNHANVVTVYDAGEDGLGPYLVMEFVEGAPLDELLRDDPPGEDHAVAIFEGLCRGVAHAHKKGVIHRDIKPSNVILDGDGTPKLLDFGLARGAVGLELSMTGYGMGTLDYSAPEQKRDAKSVDERADIYSLGATFYELLTGLKPVPLHIAKAPARWQGIVARCCEPNPDERFGSADAILSALGSPEVETEADQRPTTAPSAGHLCGANGCDQINAPGDRFCVRCGETLFLECPACETELRSLLEFCGQCGANIEASSRFRAALDSGRAAHAGGELSASLAELDTCLQLQRDHRLGPIASELESVQELRNDALDRQSRAEAFLSQAEKLQAEGEFESAKKALEEACALDPRHSVQLHELSATLEDQVATREAAQAIADVETWFSDIEALLQKKDLGTALNRVHRASTAIRSSPRFDRLKERVDAAVSFREQRVKPLRDVGLLKLLLDFELYQHEAKCVRLELDSSCRLDAHLRGRRQFALWSSFVVAVIVALAVRSAVLALGATSPPPPRTEQSERLFASKRTGPAAESDRELRGLIRRCATSSSLLKLTDKNFESPAWSAVYEEWRERVCDLTLRELSDARAAIIAAEDLEGIRIPPAPLSDPDLTQQRAEVALLLADRRRELAAGGSD